MCWIEIMETSDPTKGMNIDCMYHYDLLGTHHLISGGGA